MCAKFWAPLPPVTEKPVLADTLTNFFQLILDAYKNDFEFWYVTILQ